MKKQKKTIRKFSEWLVLVVAAGVIGTGCGSSGSSSGGTTATPTPTPTPTTQAFVQVERLARPVINEALVQTNSFLNAFNSIGPDLDLTDAAAPVRTEVVNTLNALDMGDGIDNVDPNAIATAFLPDVMRIDTAPATGQDSPPGTPAYRASNGGVNASGSPVLGRKIEDDVMDLTYFVVIGTAFTDGVTYRRPASGPGSTNESIGHKALFGQTQELGPASFPFLADPN